MSRLTLFSISLVLIASHRAASARAQAVGDRVRITRKGLPAAAAPLDFRVRPVASKDIGTLVRITADTLVLAREGSTDTLLIATRQVAQLDVSRGSESQLGTGIGYGAIIGLGTGVLVSAAVFAPASNSNRTLPCDVGCIPRSIAVVAVAVVGLVSGAVVGGVIGAVSSGEQWEQVPQNRWHLTLTPQPHGRLGLGASIPF